MTTAIGLNEEQIALSLASLSLLPTKPLTPDSPAWRRPPAPVRKEAVLVALAPFLDKPDSREGSLAIDIAFKLELPQADQQLIPLLSHDSPAVRLKVASNFLWRGEDQGALATAESLLFEENFDSHETYKLINGLEFCCRKGRNSELALQASGLLVRYIYANLDRSDNGTANLICTAIQGLEAVQHPQEAQTLQAVLQFSVEWWVRGSALSRLGALEGEAGIVRLQNALSDNQLREFAAKGLAQAARGREDAALTKSLVAALQEETRPQVLGAIVDALIAVGGEVMSILEQNADRLQPYAAMRIAWISRGITPESAAHQLIEAGVIRPPAQELLDQLEEDWQTRRKPSGIIFSLLGSADRLTCFDCETSTVPVDHRRLIQDLLEISAGVFEVEAVRKPGDRKAETFTKAI